MSRWVLYVDESGTFEDDSCPVAVAGLLCDVMVARGELRAREAALRDAFEGLAWPFHAAHCGRAVIFALASRLAQEAAATPRSSAGVCGHARTVLSFLERRHPEALLRCLDRMRRGRSPDLRDLKRLDDEARRGSAPDPAIGAGYRSLTKLKRGLANALRETLWHLTASSPGLVRGLAVACGEAEDGDGAADWHDAGGTPLASTDTARYFALLGALLERTADVLARRGGQHLVSARILTRDVAAVRPGSRPLAPADVTEVLSRFAPGPRSAVAFEPHVDAFGPGASLGHVLADFLANRSRLALEDGSSRLSQAEAQVRSWSGASVRDAAPEALSHLASSGAPRRLVAAARRRDTQALNRLETLVVSPPLRRWACEQSLEWRDGVGQ
jgi:hypothetical protein